MSQDRTIVKVSAILMPLTLSCLRAFWNEEQIMPANQTHPDYDAMLPFWVRVRDVVSGEDAIKAAGEKYLPRLTQQSDDDYDAYKTRATFFNATARTAHGYVGMIFRKPPYIQLPDRHDQVAKTVPGAAMEVVGNDVDMLGTSLYSYCKQVLEEVVTVGRSGTLVDWEDHEGRAYLTHYKAENIINWRSERVNGRNLITLVVLRESVPDPQGDDPFDTTVAEQIRVLKLVDGSSLMVDGPMEGRTAEGRRCVVDVWRQAKTGKDWVMASSSIPRRLGKALPQIPFVFHGSRHSRPEVEPVPLNDVLVLNLSHYRLDADYKHGLHYTALPTAWVSGFDKKATLKMGSSGAWVADHPGATAGFLEYKGHGLGAFENALGHLEGLMVVVGSRLLEGQRKVAETAQAMQIRQSGEDSILSSMATSVSESLTQAMRWAFWWHSTEVLPEVVTDQQVLVELNTDFRTHGIAAMELTALVNAWKEGGISQTTLFDMLRRSEVLPDGRLNEEESALIKKEKPAAAIEPSAV